MRGEPILPDRLGSINAMRRRSDDVGVGGGGSSCRSRARLARRVNRPGLSDAYRSKWRRDRGGAA